MPDADVKTNAATGTAEGQTQSSTQTGSWNGHVFTVSPSLIRGFTGLTIKGASETTAKTSGNQQYLARKAGKPVEVSLTVELNAHTGSNVRTEAILFVSQARSGAKAYFYVGANKLMACKLMLVEASVEETQIAPNGKWTSARVKLSMRQCSKNDGTMPKKKKKKKSSKKTSVRRKPGTQHFPNPPGTPGPTGGHFMGSNAYRSALRKATTYVKKTISAAKKASKAVVKPSTAKRNALLK